jgi:glycosyltransferase involved in cell wall biosynthesis
MHDLINHILSVEHIDIIHADQLSMAQFPLQIKNHPVANRHGVGVISNSKPTLVFDAHNAVWTIIDRMGENAPWFLKPILDLETHRVKRYEGLILQVYDHTLAVTDIDQRALLETVASKENSASSNLPNISVIPIAVDTEKLQPIERKSASSNILTLGTLHYPPNADGIRWFTQEVFPLIQQQEPKASLTIIGKNPPADFYRFAPKEPDSITITGYIPDLVPYFEQAALMVIPVRAGGGMRVRILEAFAQSIPVVTTTIGLEGIDALPGEDVLVADTPTDFAEAVLRLLRDTSLQTQLGINGRHLAESRYDWHVVLKKMDAVYHQGVRQSINQ